MASITNIELAECLESLARKLRNGCGNHGCVIFDPPGMGTNSNCTCRPSVFAMFLRQLSLQVDELGKGMQWHR